MSNQFFSNLLKFAIGFLSLCFMGGLLTFAFVIYISFNLPEVTSLEDYSPPLPSKILSKDGHVLLEIGIENRELVPIDLIPERVINSFLAAEDDNFYNHNGVDYLGVIRAMVANIKAGRVVQGGSTITQQVAKQLLLSRERSITRKIKDFLLAQRIEEKFSKKEILYLYLNQVYLGGGYYGVKAAAHGYFDKELTEISIAESALMAGLLVAPGKYSPYVNPRYAKVRQLYVLKRLRDTNKITQEEYESSLTEDIKMRIRQREGLKAGYFTDWVRQRVSEIVGDERLVRDGFEIKTTLDWGLQQKAEKAVLDGVKELDKRQGFKGAISHIDIDKDLESVGKELREKIYKEDSSFFIFHTDGNVTYEYTYKENETEKPELTLIKERREELLSEVEKKYQKYFVPGNSDEDKFFSFLKKNKEYPAYVIKVSDIQRIIYVSIGGVRGFIPYEHFRWAHKRDIQENRQFFPYVTNPSTILKPGDQILVNVLDKETGLWEHLHADFRKLNLSPKFKQQIQTQKYFLASLEQEPEAQGALLSIDPINGEIISLVGGVDFAKSQFNRVLQSNRQPGSAFKPILFAVSLENGFTPASIILDSPQALGGADASLNWKPRNYDGKFKGQMTFRAALENSRNIPTIKLVQEVGVEKFIDFVQRVGLDVELPRDLSISLGSFGIKMTNLVKSYALFPSGGKRLQLKSIVSVTDRYGGNYTITKDEPLAKEETPVIAQEEVVSTTEKAEDENKEEKVNPYLENLDNEQVYDKRLAYIMTNLLKGVIRNGTGRRAKSVSPFIGGKTGTTNSYVDAWFVGFSSNVVTGVWTGFDDNKTLGWGETGSKSALPIWKDFMEVAIKSRGEKDFTIPEGIVNVKIDRKTGRLADQSTQDPFLESFVSSTEPGAQENNEETTEEFNENPGQILLEDEDYYAEQ